MSVCVSSDEEARGARERGIHCEVAGGARPHAPFRQHHFSRKATAVGAFGLILAAFSDLGNERLEVALAEVPHGIIARASQMVRFCV